MPRYSYRCEACGVESIIFPLIEQKTPDCGRCKASGKMTKLLTRPTYTSAEQEEQKVGDLTVQHIEENREILEEGRESAAKEMYEPS